MNEFIEVASILPFRQCGCIMLECKFYHRALPPLERALAMYEVARDAKSNFKEATGASAQAAAKLNLATARLGFLVGQCYSGMVLDEWYTPPAVYEFAKDTYVAPAAPTDHGPSSEFDGMRASWPWPAHCPQAQAALSSAPPEIRRKFEALVQRVETEKTEARSLALRHYERALAVINQQTFAGMAPPNFVDMSEQIQIGLARVRLASESPTETSVGIFIIESLLERKDDDASFVLEYAKVYLF